MGRTAKLGLVSTEHCFQHFPLYCQYQLGFPQLERDAM